jgi:hypothetical protein
MCPWILSHFDLILPLIWGVCILFARLIQSWISSCINNICVENSKQEGRFMSLGFRSWSLSYNFDFRGELRRMLKKSNVLTKIAVYIFRMNMWNIAAAIFRVNMWKFTLKMATAMFAETLDNFQRLTRFIPESRSYTLKGRLLEILR